jgi:hypothetical protein
LHPQILTIRKTLLRKKLEKELSIWRKRYDRWKPRGAVKIQAVWKKHEKSVARNSISLQFTSFDLNDSEQMNVPIHKNGCSRMDTLFFTVRKTE